MDTQAIINSFYKICTPEGIRFLLNGAMWSIIIATVSVFFGAIFGIIGAACKLSKNRFFRFLGSAYVELIRGTPMMLQIIYIFYAVPIIYTVLTGNILRLNAYVIGMIALSINSGAYSTELIRSAIMGIDKGQWEASKTLGLNYFQMMRYVILPQAFKRIVPPMVSEYITLIKDSSLISPIGGIELLYAAQILGNRYTGYLVSLSFAGIIYLLMTLLISFFARKLERRLTESD